jgi:hypothetical protein
MKLRKVHVRKQKLKQKQEIERQARLARAPLKKK